MHGHILSAEGIVPADSTLFAETLSMDLHREVIDAMVQALIAQGIEIEQGETWGSHLKY